MLIFPAHKRKRFLAEFLLASGICVLCQLWTFRAALTTGQVDAFQQSTKPSPECLLNMFDPVSQVLPALIVQTKLIKAGIFPSWSPDSQGGTPLIAKMQNGVFSPLHTLLYTLPQSWLPYSLMLVIALRSYLAFIFAYLYARLLGINLFGGIFAAVIFLFFSVIRGELLPNMGTSGLYQPLLFLLAELNILGYRRLSGFLLPWAAAFPFLSGHFESAFYVNFFAGIYFLIRIMQHKNLALDAKTARLAEFAGLMLAGLAIAAIQILPSIEYVNLSYNKVWHDLRWFDLWDYQTIGKRLSGQDAPLLLAGFGSLALFFFFLKRSVKSKPRLVSPDHVIAAGLLSLAIACLINLGLDESFSLFVFPASGVWGFLLFVFLLFLSIWEWSQTDKPEFRALGWTMLMGMILILKTPLINNILIHIPPFGNFHNATGNRWEIQTGFAVLSAAAFERCRGLSVRPFAERLKQTLMAFSFLCVISLGYLGGRQLKAAAADLIPAGPAHPENSSIGAIMGPRHQAVFGGTQKIVGWVSSLLPEPSSIVVGVIRGNRLAYAVQAKIDPFPSRSRRYFHAALPLPADPGSAPTAALVQYADGKQGAVLGTEFETRALGAASWIAIAAIAAFPLFILLPSIPARIVSLLVLVAAMQYKAEVLPAGQIPFKLDSIEKVLQDTGHFRVSSLQDNFLRSDYLNSYGLADIRTGGDFLDVLPMVYFNHLYSSLLQDSRNTASFENGLKLLGLGNVKYLLETPDFSLPAAGLQALSKGTDMTVYRNGFFLPRAVFFDRSAYIPMGDWLNWGARGAFLSPIIESLSQRKLDPKTTVLLNDLPSIVPSHRPSSKEASVRIDEYRPDRVRLSVDTDRPGFVFLSDNDFPGWQADLNGSPARILRSWMTFRAVEVPAGKSTITFAYKSRPLRIGLWLSLLAFFVWTACYFKYGYGQIPGATECKELCGVFANHIMCCLIGMLAAFWSVWAVFSAIHS